MMESKKLVFDEKLQNDLPELQKQVAAAIKDAIGELNCSIETAAQLGVDISIGQFQVIIHPTRFYPQLKAELSIKEVL